MPMVKGTMNKIKFLEELFALDILFALGGPPNAYVELEIDDVIAMLKDPLATKAKLFGVSKKEYTAWDMGDDIEEP